MSKNRFEGSELLHAYVDGELSLEEKLRVEQWLETHPDDARMVAEWQKQNQGLNDLFATKINEPAPETLSVGTDSHQPLSQNSTLPSLLPQIAASFLILALGVAGGWFGRDYLNNLTAEQTINLATHQSFAQPAMEAHWIYTPEVRHPVEVAQNEEDHLAKWLSYRLETPLTIPDLTAQGFDLMGGRLLPSGTGPAAQFMYESKEGSRITIYLSKSFSNTPAEAAFHFNQAGSTRAFYWYSGNLGYAVIGDIERNKLFTIVNDVYQQL
ncbi:anti-sigma factor [Kiloniella sp. EL199]|uniref:anti-sigma factor family protein n=1 Tax=Kiloniella sp. EL199 TaxID=2107581 RepID=UPI000EA0C675|nr:anti-sigma factor [Kiloniella sp. EL199]